MGLELSKLTKTEDNLDAIFYELNNIISQIILTQNFQTRVELDDSDKCKKVIMLAKTIFNREFTPIEIKYFYNRIRNEQYYVLNSSIDNLLDNESVPDKQQKQQMCYAIAEYYNKIANIFKAIISTITPWKNNTSGKTYTNFCNERIDRLESNHEYFPQETICKPFKGNTMEDEYGVQDLENLLKYYKNSSGQYDIDVIKKNFLDNPTMNNLTTFSTINQNDYRTAKLCNTLITDDIKDGKIIKKKEDKCLSNTAALYSIFDENIKNSKDSYNKNIHNLYNYIKLLFIKEILPGTNKPVWKINPNLTIDKLNQLIPNIIKDIAKCYIDCQLYYEKGLKIYAALIETNSITCKNKPEEPASSSTPIPDLIPENKSSIPSEDNTISDQKLSNISYSPKPVVPLIKTPADPLIIKPPPNESSSDKKSFNKPFSDETSSNKISSNEIYSDKISSDKISSDEQIKNSQYKNWNMGKTMDWSINKNNEKYQPKSAVLSTGILKYIKQNYNSMIDTSAFGNVLKKYRYKESKEFQGPQLGYVFTNGDKGIGYYRDLRYIPAWEFNFYKKFPDEAPGEFDKNEYNDKTDFYGEYGPGFYKKK